MYMRLKAEFSGRIYIALKCLQELAVPQVGRLHFNVYFAATNTR